MRKLSIFLSVVLLLGLFVGCGKEKGVKFTDYDLQPIEREMSMTDMAPYEAQGLQISFDATEVTVGKVLTVTVVDKLTVSSKNFEYNYYLADWGDGTRSYFGPFDIKYSGQLTHVYEESGVYDIVISAINAETGELIATSKVFTIHVNEGKIDKDPFVQRLAPISSSVENTESKAENVFDNDNSTSWKSEVTKAEGKLEYIGALFDDYYTLSQLEVKVPQSVDVWSANLAIEYTTNGGETWFSLPKYYYNYSSKPSAYSYSSNIKLPNPKGATMVFELDGIVANGLRFTNKRYGKVDGEKQLVVSEMRIFGTNELLMYTSLDTTFDADINNLWTIYGTAKTEPKVRNTIKGPNTNPFKSGATMTASTEWLEWNQRKFGWTDYELAFDTSLEFLLKTRTGSDGWSNDDGYVWATNSAPQHLNLQNHYTYNSIFIIAARNYLLMQNNLPVDFFNIENEVGQTLGDNLDKAMNYMLNTLQGKDGLLIILDPNNDGTANGVSSNYWDALKFFGYKSAYENSLFYYSVLCMADIERYRGDIAKAEYYEELSILIRQKFNETFWDSDKKRYVCNVDINGKINDYGMTVVNFYAMYYGLANEEQCKDIYSWLDGERIIEGDTSTGKDIYSFGFAARTNTLDIATGDKPYLWWDHDGQLPAESTGPNSGYGYTIQNGGAIMYTSYYDLVSRFRNISAENAMSRLNGILEEFRIDQLRRYPDSASGGNVTGIVGEFPESGLVPLAFMDGMLGFNVMSDGLHIDPSLPKEMEYAGITKYYFNGLCYQIEVQRSRVSAELIKTDDGFMLKVPANKETVLTYNNSIV